MQSPTAKGALSPIGATAPAWAGGGPLAAAGAPALPPVMDAAPLTDISAASRIPSPSASSTSVVEQLKNNIARIESGGFKNPYTALGAHNPRMGYAVGKYQVMESNIGPWTKDVFGRPMTTKEFMASPQAQEAVATSKLTEYVGKYGPEGAARAWFGGPGGVDKPLRTDVHGRLNIGQYGRQAMRGIDSANAPAIPPPQVAEAAPRNIFDQPPAPVQMAQSEPAPTQSFQPVEAQPMAPRLADPSTPVVPGREPVKPGLLEQLAGPISGADRLKLAMAAFGDKQQAQPRGGASPMRGGGAPQGSAQDYIMQYILSRMRA